MTVSRTAMFVVLMASTSCGLWACDSTDEAGAGLDATPDAAPDAASTDAGMSDAQAPDAAAPAQCPAMLAPNQCASWADCSPDEVCYDPNGGPTASGQCADDELDQCDTDADCAALDPAFVCAYPDTTCGIPQGRQCLGGCAGNCPVGETCGADRRCAPSACDATAACPPDFACGADGHCARRTCDDHTDCATCCVNGQCFEAPGHCSYLPQ